MPNLKLTYSSINKGSRNQPEEGDDARTLYNLAQLLGCSRAMCWLQLHYGILENKGEVIYYININELGIYTNIKDVIYAVVFSGAIFGIDIFFF